MPDVFRLGSVRVKGCSNQEVPLYAVFGMVYFPLVLKVSLVALVDSDSPSFMADNKGFVRVSCLKPMLDSERGAADTTVLPGATGTAVLPTRPAPVAASSRPSTVPRPAPAPPEQAPPRYEDIFPVVPTTLPQGTGLPQAPPPRYSSESTATLTSQPPLPSKPEPLPPDSDGQQHLGDGDYYSPPLDRQPSAEYNSPVSEEHNIYEEIDQVCVCVCIIVFTYLFL